MAMKRLAPWLIVVLAFGARFAHLAAHWDTPLGADSYQYEDLGWKIANGQPYAARAEDSSLLFDSGRLSAFRTPGLPLFIAAHYVVLGRRPNAPRVTLVLLSALACGLLFLFARRRFGDRVAWIAGLAWALWPEAIHSYYGADHLFGEPLAAALIAGVLWLQETSFWPVGGVLLGWAVLSRGYLVLLPPFWVLGCLAFARPLMPSLRRALVVGAIAALPVLCWSYRNWTVYHRFIPLSTEEGVAFWYGNNQHARGSWNGNWWTSPELHELLAAHPEITSVDEPEKSRIYGEVAKADVKRGGIGHFVWLEARKLTIFFYPRDMTDGWHPAAGVALLLLPLGAWVVLRRTRDATTMLLVAILAAPLTTVLLAFGEGRFRACADSAILIFAAVGADYLLSRRAS